MNDSNLVQNLNNLKFLPTSWEVKNFKDVVSDNSGGNKKLAKSVFLETGEIAIVDQGKKLIAGYYNDSSLAVKTLPPYVVFGDHTRAFKYIDFPFVMGADGTKVLQPKNDNCDTKYLYYFFLSINVPNTGYNRHFKYLKELKIPLPPLDKQKKIAAILDAADTYRQKTKALITKYDELTQSLFLDMFGDPRLNEQNFEQNILDVFLEFITYGLTVRPKYIENGIRLISAREIRSGKVDLTSGPQISESDFKKLSAKGKPQKGEILFSKTGSIGHSAIIDTDVKFAITQNAARLVFKKSVNPIFAFQQLRTSYFQSLCQQRAKGNAVKDLQLGDMKKLPFISPPINLQNQFAERIKSIELQKEQAQASLIQADNLFNSLLQRAFKGELV
jgi:type I restriction enzyme S subunit